MPVLITQDEQKGTTTIRHSWRLEVFSEFGDDPEIRVHRQEVIYDTDTQAEIKVKKDRVVTRFLSELPEGPKNLILSLANQADLWEAEDRAKEPK